MIADANFATLWERVSAAVPDRLAVYDGGREVTYAAFDEAAGRLAAAWRDVGVRPGTKIGCYLFSGIAYLEAVYAALKLGAVPVNVNYRYRSKELVQVLADADVEVLVFQGELADRVEEALPELPDLRALVQAGGGEPLAGAVGLDDFKAPFEPVPHASRSGADELFLYTGGTTGLPKGVIWQQRALFESLSYQAYGVAGEKPPADVEEAVAIVRRIAAEERSPRTLPLAPLMHATGLFNAMGTLLLGGTVMFPPGRSLDPRAVWETVEARRVTRMIIAGDAMARPLAEELERAEREGRPHKLDSLQAVISAGMVWSDEAKLAFLERHPMLLLEVFASTEGGPYAYAETASPEDLPTRFVLVPGARVLDERGGDVQPGSGSIGTLAYTGPLPLGYYKDAEKTASTYRSIGGDRYVMPGDLARVAPDGSLVLLGRGSSVINTGGEKVYPAEVESALLSHPSVVDCAVLGLPDEVWGETVAALVCLSDETTAEELIAHAAKSLAGYKKPRQVIVLEALPRGPNAKLDLAGARRLAADRLRGGDAEAAGQFTARRP
jgi:acyl-CoA synthetase (AMP-forming)/AMP-acid ligase II